MISPTQKPLSENKQLSQEADMYVPGGIRTRNTGKQAAGNQRLRPRGHRDRQKYLYNYMNLKQYARLEVRGIPMAISVSTMSFPTIVISCFLLWHSKYTCV